MYRSLAYQVAVDAQIHGGLGDLNRVNLQVACATLAIPVLSVLDVVATELTTVLAFYNIFTHEPQFRGPPIRAYAQ
jgi:hypothetical protein